MWGKTEAESRKRFGCAYPWTSGGFPGDSDGKESACNAGEPNLIPWLEKSPGEGNGYPLQYSYLWNHRGRGTWWATVHEVGIWCNTHTAKNSIAVSGIIYSDIYYTFPPEGGACQSLLAGCEGGLKYILPLKNVPFTKRSQCIQKHCWCGSRHHT